MSAALSPSELRARAHALADGPLAERAAEIDRSERYPHDTVALMREAGLFGMTLPVAYGGQGASFATAAEVIEIIARSCATSARIVVESNMGGIAAVMRYGSAQQKAAAAERVLAGDKPAICITEPHAGSDATSMTTTARPVAGGYVLNGKKHWITGGGVAELYVIFAQVLDAQGDRQGIGAFMAFKDEPGLSIGRREPTMGLRGMPETEVLFEDLHLPGERLILPAGELRHGFGKLMDAYNSQRVGAAAVALGIAQGAFEHALAFVQEREQFGRPIAEFQGLQWMLADMATELDAARLLIRAAATSAAPFPEPMAAAKAKVFAAEMAVRVTNHALQLHGAAGYSRDRPLERMVRDARMFTIGGGTAQVLRTQIASRLLQRKLPQTRTGYAMEQRAAALAAE